MLGFMDRPEKAAAMATVEGARVRPAADPTTPRAGVRAPRTALAVALLLGGLVTAGIACYGLFHAAGDRGSTIEAVGDPGVTAAPAQMRADLFAPHTYAAVGGPSEVVMMPDTYEPGESSGWHSHRGLHGIVVTSGGLTVYDAQCQRTTYAVGQPFLGGNGVHLVRNETDQPVQMVVTYILAKDAGLEDFVVPASPRSDCPAATVTSG
jgi:quercetin dioxygenase-like cupin family protein